MSNSPKVSVIIPTYNCARFVGDAVRSVLAQSFQDFELVVVDDGSTDDTEKMLQDYRGGIIYVYQSNRGLPAALNTGIRVTRGELIAILDADDLWDPDKIKEQVALLDNCPQVGLCYTNFTPFGSKTDYATGFDERDGALTRYARRPLGPHSHLITSPSFLEDLLRYQASPKPTTVMFRRKCLEKVGLFDETLTFCQDTQMWLRMAKYFPFAYVDRCLVQRRVRPDSLSSSQNDRRYTMEHIHMLENLENWIPLSPRERSITNALLSSYLFAAGYTDFADGQLDSSRRYLRSSLRTHFSFKGFVYFVMTYLPTHWIRTLRVLKRQIAQ